MPGYGQAGFVGLAKESSWSIPVAVASGDFAAMLNENVALVIERFVNRNIVGRVTEPDDMAGLRRVAGDIHLTAHPVTVGHIFNGLMGQGSKTITVALSGFLWTTEWWPSPSDFFPDAPLPSYSLEMFRDVTSMHRIAGSIFDKAQFTLVPNQDHRALVGVIAKT